MSNAIADHNFVRTKLGVWCVDGVTTIPIKISSVNGGVAIDEVSTISFNPSTIDFRDANYKPCWMGINSDTGQPCPLFVNANGEVLVDV